jgi:hypothetical protein
MAKPRSQPLGTFHAMVFQVVAKVAGVMDQQRCITSSAVTFAAIVLLRALVLRTNLALRR